MKNIIFGPVPSRRLGRSLGITLVPHKICTFDCLYCEVGKSTTVTTKRAPYIPAEKVLGEFKKVYPIMKDRIDVITLTGAGEPTLNSDLNAIVSGIKEVAIHPLAVLTNSALMGNPDVAAALMMCDIVVSSLDAVTQDIFEQVDKPLPGIQINDIISAVAEFSLKFTGKLYLELLLVRGVNNSIEDLQRFVEAVERIHYTKVHLGTVFRPPAWEDTERLTDDELHAVCEFLTSEGGLNVEPVKVAEHQNIRTDASIQLLNMLRIRPVTMQDIIFATGLNKEEVEQFLKASKVVQRIHDGEVYYSLNK